VVTSPYLIQIGVVLSGGQAPGGHNVIVGVYEYIKSRHPNGQVFGFLGGPEGIYNGKYTEITQSMIDYYKNRGGFDMICSGRHKIESEEHKKMSMDVCRRMKLDGLIVIGGDDSNTNACVLAEYYK
jgi:6-phosphofructokinase